VISRPGRRGGRGHTSRGRSRRCSVAPSTQGATTLANLDLLLMTVFCPAADLLPERAKNARRRFGYRDSVDDV